MTIPFFVPFSTVNLSVNLRFLRKYKERPGVSCFMSANTKTTEKLIRIRQKFYFSILFFTKYMSCIDLWPMYNCNRRRQRAKGLHRYFLTIIASSIEF